MHRSPVYRDVQVFPLQWKLPILKFSVKPDKIQTLNIVFCGLFLVWFVFTSSHLHVLHPFLFIQLFKQN